MSVCFSVAAVPLSGCVWDWQEAGQGQGLLALGFDACGVQRAATGRSAHGPSRSCFSSWMAEVSQ